MEILVTINHPPEDIRRIEGMVRDYDSFVALCDGDHYSLLSHVNPNKRVRFRAMGDLNFTSRIASLAKCEDMAWKKDLNITRWATAVLAFMQIAKIDFKYDISTLERQHKFDTENAAGLFDDFVLINNLSTKMLIDFALGRIDRIPSAALEEVSANTALQGRKNIPSELMVDLHYIFMLKIALLSKKQMKGHVKVIRLIDWMRDEFLFSAPALAFANIYFSPKRYKRMLKGTDKAQVLNAAWDLALLYEWGKRALHKTSGWSVPTEATRLVFSRRAWWASTTEFPKT